MTRIHHLKTRREFFAAVLEGVKPFEVRRFDRDWRKGDIVVLREWDDADGYTGRWAARAIGYILPPGTSEGLAPGFGVLAISAAGVASRLRNAGGPALEQGSGLLPVETVPPPEPATV